MTGVVVLFSGVGFGSLSYLLSDTFSQPQADLPRLQESNRAGESWGQAGLRSTPPWW